LWCYFFSQEVAPSVWRMQLALLVGGYYLLEEPDLCGNISGISTWTSEATEWIKIASAPWCSVSFRKASSESSRGYFVSDCWSSALLIDFWVLRFLDILANAPVVIGVSSSSDRSSSISSSSCFGDCLVFWREGADLDLDNLLAVLLGFGSSLSSSRSVKSSIAGQNKQLHP